MSLGINANALMAASSLPYAQFLGYEKDGDGLPKIVESEAKTVGRYIKCSSMAKPHQV